MCSGGARGGSLHAGPRQLRVVAGGARNPVPLREDHPLCGRCRRSRIHAPRSESSGWSTSSRDARPDVRRVRIRPTTTLGPAPLLLAGRVQARRPFRLRPAAAVHLGRRRRGGIRSGAARTEGHRPFNVGAPAWFACRRSPRCSGHAACGCPTAFDAAALPRRFGGFACPARSIPAFRTWPATRSWWTARGLDGTGPVTGARPGRGAPPLRGAAAGESSGDHLACREDDGFEAARFRAGEGESRRGDRGGRTADERGGWAADRPALPASPRRAGRRAHRAGRPGRGRRAEGAEPGPQGPRQRRHQRDLLGTRFIRS